MRKVFVFNSSNFLLQRIITHFCAKHLMIVCISMLEKHFEKFKGDVDSRTNFISGLFLKELLKLE